MSIRKNKLSLQTPKTKGKVISLQSKNKFLEAQAKKFKADNKALKTENQNLSLLLRRAKKTIDGLHTKLSNGLWRPGVAFGGR